MAAALIQSAIATCYTQHEFPPTSVHFIEVTANDENFDDEAKLWGAASPAVKLKENGTYGCELRITIMAQAGARAVVRLFPEVTFDGSLIRLGLVSETGSLEIRSETEREQKCMEYAALMVAYLKKWIPRIANKAAGEKRMGFLSGQ